MSIGPSVNIDGARELLRDLGMDDERSNERSAMVFLALAHLRPGNSWGDATNGMYGTRAIMDWIAEAFGVEYKPNTRETVRRFTLHQFGRLASLRRTPTTQRGQRIHRNGTIVSRRVRLTLCGVAAHRVILRSSISVLMG